MVATKVYRQAGLRKATEEQASDHNNVHTGDRYYSGMGGKQLIQTAPKIIRIIHGNGCRQPGDTKVV
jgi:hypothetical protein